MSYRIFKEGNTYHIFKGDMPFAIFYGFPAFKQFAMDTSGGLLEMAELVKSISVALKQYSLTDEEKVKLSQIGEL